ncbi:MAG: methyltransferase domain-containing protein [Alphaproteobacteria bacterium]|nr:methyltransferase domain-containing protein [Alphaproteobacteria bacterium]
MSAPSHKATLDARGIALDALDHVLSAHKPLEAALEGARGFSALSTRDRAFARLLVATTLRHGGELDALIDALVERPLPRAARAIHHILALGIAQIVFLKTPAHAAVDTSVRLAAKLQRGKYRGLVNAVLRRVVREGESLGAGFDAPKLNMPIWLWQVCENAYGAEAARGIAEAHMAEPPLDLTLRDGQDAGLWADRLDAEPLATGSLRRKAGGLINELPGFKEGAWWVQDAAAALPARLFPDPRGKRILDLCAAPGGKTMQLAAAGSQVTAVDRSADRLAVVKENLERVALKATLIAADGRDFEPGITFDGVLLDAPCSATGTVRRHPDICHIKTADSAAGLIGLQDALLARAARLVAPGGILVYAVCSLDPSEGEDRIAALLAQQPEFRRLAIDAGALGGTDDWISAQGDLRTQPFHMSQIGGMDGFFAARLQRLGEAAR